ncbi:hypothetical protein PYCCODRAFT_312906 [Trametes coccinea BRFM310]|uniref:Uncharacterized protein n=1 Tax=Trametes coccinea (strain BRFM310) TaxID=1353009 RepID=A0A1Y2IP25_TRAC3|nr:hypothetical protein PYCCODRAFT_312906 [Trametes coccinea BRFM310]
MRLKFPANFGGLRVGTGYGVGLPSPFIHLAASVSLSMASTVSHAPIRLSGYLSSLGQDSTEVTSSPRRCMSEPMTWVWAASWLYSQVVLQVLSRPLFVWENSPRLLLSLETKEAPSLALPLSWPPS